MRERGVRRDPAQTAGQRFEAINPDRRGRTRCEARAQRLRDVHACVDGRSRQHHDNRTALGGSLTDFERQRIDRARNRCLNPGPLDGDLDVEQPGLGGGEAAARAIDRLTARALQQFVECGARLFDPGRRLLETTIGKVELLARYELSVDKRGHPIALEPRRLLSAGQRREASACLGDVLGARTLIGLREFRGRRIRLRARNGESRVRPTVVLHRQDVARPDEIALRNHNLDDWLVAVGHQRESVAFERAVRMHMLIRAIARRARHGHDAEQPAAHVASPRLASTDAVASCLIRRIARGP
jgi:hypothetical protein